jgi:hypothetical protein
MLSPEPSAADRDRQSAASLRSEPAPPGRSERPLSDALRHSGYIFMCFWGLLMSSGFLGGAAFGVELLYMHPSLAGFAVAPVAALCLLLAVWHIWASMAAIMDALNGGLPAPLRVALMQPSWPRWGRWFPALWWLFNFGLGTALAVLTMIPAPPNVGFLLLLAFLCTCFSYAAFGFLLLAITCYTHNPAHITRVWGWRRKVSLGHGLAVLAAGLLR